MIDASHFLDFLDETDPEDTTELDPFDREDLFYETHYPVHWVVGGTDKIPEEMAQKICKAYNSRTFHNDVLVYEYMNHEVHFALKKNTFVGAVPSKYTARDAEMFVRGYLAAMGVQ